MYQGICDSVITKAEELCNHRSVVVRAQAICDKFKDLNRLFSDVHCRISHPNPVNEEETGEMQGMIKIYMSLYQREFPVSHLSRDGDLGSLCMGNKVGRDTRSHQLPKEVCLGTVEQRAAAQSINKRTHGNSVTSLPRADAVFTQQQNVTVCFISVTCASSNLSVCIIVFIFMFILNVWVHFTAAMKTN